VDARDPVGSGTAWIPCGRETELQRCDFVAGSRYHVGGDSGIGGGEIRWTASPGLGASQGRADSFCNFAPVAVTTPDLQNVLGRSRSGNRRLWTWTHAGDEHLIVAVVAAARVDRRVDSKRLFAIHFEAKTAAADYDWTG